MNNNTPEDWSNRSPWSDCGPAFSLDVAPVEHRQREQDYMRGMCHGLEAARQKPGDVERMQEECRAYRSRVGNAGSPSALKRVLRNFAMHRALESNWTVPKKKEHA